MSSRQLILVHPAAATPDRERAGAPLLLSEAGRLAAHALAGEMDGMQVEVLSAPQTASLETANVFAVRAGTSVTVVDEPTSVEAVLDDLPAGEVVVVGGAELLRHCTASLPADPSATTPWLMRVSSGRCEPVRLVGPIAPLGYRPFLRNAIPEALAAQLLVQRPMLMQSEGLAARLSLRGSLLRAGRFYGEARTALDAALDLFRAQEDRSGEAIALLRLAILVQYEGDFDEAFAKFETARGALEAHQPDFVHFWSQHYAKLLVEAGEVSDGIEQLRRATELRTSANEVLRRSSAEALAAAKGRLRAE